MRRALLLVVGAQLPPSTARTLGEWWRSGQEGVLLVQAEEADARLVLLDLDRVEVLADTDGAPNLAVANLPPGRSGVAEALEAASRLGARGPALVSLLRSVLGPDDEEDAPAEDQVDGAEGAGKGD